MMKCAPSRTVVIAISVPPATDARCCGRVDVKAQVLSRITFNAGQASEFFHRVAFVQQRHQMQSHTRPRRPIFPGTSVERARLGRAHVLQVARYQPLLARRWGGVSSLNFAGVSD